MPTTTLALPTLHLLSDGLKRDFDEQLAAAVLDCRQRPSLAAKREVCVKFSITPHIDPVTTSKRPARKLEPIRARRSRNNQLQFDFLAEDE